MTPSNAFLPARHEGDRLLPAVITVMVFLASIALVGSLILGSGLKTWSQSLDDTLTLQIVEADPRERDRQVEAALTLLRATPGIRSADILANSDVLALVAPWLGDIPLDSDLPLPALISIELTRADAIQTRSLAERLRSVAEGAILDDHQSWLGEILDLTGMLQSILWAVTALVVISTIATVIFGCRAGLAAHQDTIDIVHLMGAEDRKISHAFEKRYFLHGLKGGILGALLATAVLFGLGQVAARLTSGLVTALVPQTSIMIWLPVVALLIALLTLITARFTVRSALAKTL